MAASYSKIMPALAGSALLATADNVGLHSIIALD